MCIQERLEEILLAIETIDRHLQRGPLDDLLVFDAICMRISQITLRIVTSKPAARSSPKPLNSICRASGSPFTLCWMVRVRQRPIPANVLLSVNKGHQALWLKAARRHSK